MGLHCYCSPSSGAKNFHFSVILRHTLNFAERKSTKTLQVMVLKVSWETYQLSSTKCHEASPGFPKLPKYEGGNYFKIHCVKKRNHDHNVFGFGSAPAGKSSSILSPGPKY